MEKIKREVRLFGSVSTMNLRELIMESQIRVVENGEEIFSRNDHSSTFFNIIQGEVKVYVKQDRVFAMGNAQFFGEMSLISGRPRGNTVIADTECVLLETPRHAILNLMRKEKTVRDLIDTVSILRMLQLVLAPDAPIDVIREVAESAELKKFAGGDTLYAEGDPSDTVYLVRSGSLTLSRQVAGKDRIVAYRAAGEIAGLMGLSGKSFFHQDTATATVETDAIGIALTNFRELLRADPDFHAQVRQQIEKNLTLYTRMQVQPESGEILSFMMSQGLGEATDVLIIDELLCVGCDNCEIACAATHGRVSRLDRKAGPTFASLHIPSACRHCENAHCMLDCPPDAIHRSPNGEVYIDDTCIGCTNCVQNCPYGVIQMAEVTPNRSLLGKLFGQQPEGLGEKAAKCDMCKDVKTGPACVNSCPTGAAIRVHAEQLVDMAKNRVSE